MTVKTLSTSPTVSESYVTVKLQHQKVQGSSLKANIHLSYTNACMQAYTNACMQMEASYLMNKVKFTYML